MNETNPSSTLSVSSLSSIKEVMELSIKNLKIGIHEGKIHLYCNYASLLLTGGQSPSGFFEANVEIKNMEDGLQLRFLQLIEMSEEVLRELITEKLQSERTRNE